MMAIINKRNEASPSGTCQGLSKQPRSMLDMVTGVTESHSTHQQPTFDSNIRHYLDDDTDYDGDATPRSYEE